MDPCTGSGNPTLSGALNWSPCQYNRLALHRLGWSLPQQSVDRRNEINLAVPSEPAAISVVLLAPLHDPFGFPAPHENQILAPGEYLAGCSFEARPAA
jgi:hypothetical protein